jgi:hypothetical protein
MSLEIVNDVDPVKAAIVVFLAGVVAAVFIYIYNTQVAPTLRGTLQKKAA